MRRFVFAIFAAVLLMFGCKGGKTTDTEATADSDSTAIDTTAVDTMEQLISETPMPKAADELFDDFFFNFAANKRLQLSRIKFPLPVNDNGKASNIQKGAWKTEHFFMRQGYYTLIFDNRKQMGVVKDTSVDHVVVEKIFLAKKIVKEYVFERENGLWMMQSVATKHMAANGNASFLAFYQRFASDTAFQARHLDKQVQFVGPDPDDDFSEMTGLITPDTWPAFAPELPHKMIYNIIYGKTNVGGNTKIFVMRGIANGLEMELSFKRMGGRWVLTKLST